MIYNIENNIIKVYDKTQFNPMHILECGQIFRYGKDEHENYYVISKNHKATIIEQIDHYDVISDDSNYFVNFFDLNTDYNKIKEALKQNKIISPMVDFGYGIRILNADPEEIIYSFIISQNNNIKRIQNIIEKLCQIGEQQSDFIAFPTTKKLASLPLEFYQTLGAGYRDKFLKETADTLSSLNIDEIKDYDTDTLMNFLLNLKGVGPKVASCILLFGFGRKNKFPVDTWIEQVYYNHFSQEKRTRPEIQKYFENEFKENSGLAQQYLFFYERSK
jgi:N-glycosylase/DNA lyase